MTDLLLHSNESIREATLLVLGTLGQFQEGSEAVLKNSVMFENLVQLMEDSEDSIRLKVAKCIEMLSRSWICKI